MTWTDAKALIDEIRRLHFRRYSTFLDRLEFLQPNILIPHDAEMLTEIYRLATGGGHRIYNHGGRQ